MAIDKHIFNTFPDLADITKEWFKVFDVAAETSEPVDETGIFINWFNRFVGSIIKPEISMYLPDFPEQPAGLAVPVQNILLEVCRLTDGCVRRETIIKEILTLLRDSLGCKTVSIAIIKKDTIFCYASFDQYHCRRQGVSSTELAGTACISMLMLFGCNMSLPNVTKMGSFWVNNKNDFSSIPTLCPNVSCNEDIQSFARVPLSVNGEKIGVLHLDDLRPNRFNNDIIITIEIIATTIAMLLKQEKTEIQLHEKVLNVHNLLYYDTLTKLPSRLFLEDCLHDLLTEATDRKELFLLFLDMDKFKRIEDTFGHDISNEVLCAVANRLKRFVGMSNSVVRWESDIFLMLIEHPNVECFLREVLRGLNMPFHARNHDFYLSASIGVAKYPQDGRNIQSLVRSASIAMHRAKGGGGNGFCFSTPEMKIRASELQWMEKDLRSALKEEQLCVYYQPQVQLPEGTVIGAEALLRWNHPKRGIIQPDVFIPLAEETGLIVPVGEWVLRTSCEQNKRWQDQGYRPIKIAVNISARQFQHPDFVDKVKTVLKEVDLSPRWLELEITESNVMRSGNEAVAILKALKEIGVSIAIDDFGTGYSSLSYLSKFPVDTIKIDKSFIPHTDLQPHNVAIIRSIVAMASSMKMNVIAEGVEREDQCNLVSNEGCKIGQGFLFGVPMPPAEMGTLLEQVRKRFCHSHASKKATKNVISCFSNS